MHNMFLPYGQRQTVHKTRQKKLKMLIPNVPHIGDHAAPDQAVYTAPFVDDGSEPFKSGGTCVACGTPPTPAPVATKVPDGAGCDVASNSGDQHSHIMRGTINIYLENSLILLLQLLRQLVSNAPQHP